MLPGGCDLGQHRRGYGGGPVADGQRPLQRLLALRHILHHLAGPTVHRTRAAGLSRAQVGVLAQAVAAHSGRGWAARTAGCGSRGPAAGARVRGGLPGSPSAVALDGGGRGEGGVGSERGRHAIAVAVQWLAPGAAVLVAHATPPCKQTRGRGEGTSFAQQALASGNFIAHLWGDGRTGSGQGAWGALVCYRHSPVTSSSFTALAVHSLQ